MSGISGLCYIYSRKYGAYCDFKETNGRMEAYFNREKAYAAPLRREQAEELIKRLEDEQPEIIGQFDIREG